MPNTAQVETVSVPAALNRAIFTDQAITVVSNGVAELIQLRAT
jgi:hypothetical protein